MFAPGRNEGPGAAARSRFTSGMSDVLSLIQPLDHWAEVRPEGLAYRFLNADESVAAEVTYAALRRRAHAVARALAANARPGDRALLLFDADPGFVSAFFGCLVAGVIAVPSDPPHGRRAWTGIDALAVDCRPSVILTTRTLRDRWQREIAALAAEHRATVIDVDAVTEVHAGNDAPAVDIGPDTPAFLQYTSGSTSRPKGVIVTHANALANVRAIEEVFELDDRLNTVSWLPLFHDMGLIGFVLVPFYLGGTSTVMSPAAFLEKPVRWLRAISRYRATTTSAPNFAYDLCVSKIRAEDRAGLDLSCLSRALNGAEPVSARTIARFEETFADTGLRRGAIRPCYGMAEATLFVSAVPPASSARILDAAVARASGSGVSATASFHVDTGDIVSCGVTARGASIRIVDPATGRPCADGEAGEIWFNGPGVASGYWQNATATDETFIAEDRTPAGLRSTSGRWLRTGDLGCLEGGELFVMGRLKELLIIRGRNFVPHDIEEVVGASHPALRAAHVAALAVTRDDAPALAIVAEIDREQWRTFDAQQVVDAVLAAVHDRFALGVSSVTLLRPGSLPKTTSGKLRRLECARRLARADAGGVDEWSVLHEWRQREAAAGPVASAVPQLSTPDAAALDAMSPDDLTDAALEWLRVRLARALECSPEQIADEEPFARFGLDSAVAVTLTAELADWLGVELSPTVFWEHAHPLALAEHLAALRLARPAAARVELV